MHVLGINRLQKSVTWCPSDSPYNQQASTPPRQHCSDTVRRQPSALLKGNTQRAAGVGGCAKHTKDVITGEVRRACSVMVDSCCFERRQCW